MSGQSSRGRSGWRLPGTSSLPSRTAATRRPATRNASVWPSGARSRISITRQPACTPPPSPPTPNWPTTSGPRTATTPPATQLAAAGQGEGAAKLDEKERTRLRQQALDWLRAELAPRRRQLETGKPDDRAEVHMTMRHWQQDTDLAGIRDAAALAKLPADQQKACTQLWADVAALLKKARTPATKEPTK